MNPDVRGLLSPYCWIALTDCLSGCSLATPWNSLLVRWCPAFFFPKRYPKMVALMWKMIFQTLHFRGPHFAITQMLKALAIFVHHGDQQTTKHPTLGVTTTRMSAGQGWWRLSFEESSNKLPSFLIWKVVLNLPKLSLGALKGGRWKQIGFHRTQLVNLCCQ